MTELINNTRAPDGAYNAKKNESTCSWATTLIVICNFNIFTQLIPKYITNYGGSSAALSTLSTNWGKTVIIIITVDQRDISSFHQKINTHISSKKFHHNFSVNNYPPFLTGPRWGKSLSLCRSSLTILRETSWSSLSLVGGTVGLLTGFSIISGIEII